MLKKTTIIATVLILGCSRTVVLQNGYTKASTNPKVFKHRVHFNQSILQQLDTAVIYEQYNTNYYEGLQKQSGILARNNYKDPNTIYGVYRFYGNGCYSYFNLDRNKPGLTKEMFDPNYTGWRGVLYHKNDKIFGDLFTQVGQLRWELGISTEKFSFHGDTVYIESKNGNKELYIKRKIDPDLLHHNADW